MAGSAAGVGNAMASIKGGEKFAAALKDMAAQLDRPMTVRVGFLENATGSDGMPIPLRAALNEYGVPSHNQPPRPFFRNMIAAKSKEWPAAIAGLLKANSYDVRKVLGLVGEGIKGQLQQSIRDLWSPPLAPSTIKRKGFDKPLIEKGEMLNAVDYDIKS
jgi:hypothetical protein